MEIFKWKVVICIIIVIGFYIGCQSNFVTKCENYTTKDYQLRKIEVDSLLLSYLTNDTISSDGAYLFHGKRISPFSEQYNDASGIYLTEDSLSYYKIIFISSNKTGEKYAYKLSIFPKPFKRKIKINREDLQKVMKSGIYYLLLFKDNVAKLRYHLDLVY